MRKLEELENDMVLVTTMKKEWIILLKEEHLRTDIYICILKERNRGFFASFFLALRAHERKKSGGFPSVRLPYSLVDYNLPCSW